MNWLLAIGMLAGLVIAGVTFVFNSSTPMQLDPIPFFGGAAIFVICFIAFIARIVTSR